MHRLLVLVLLLPAALAGPAAVPVDPPWTWPTHPPRVVNPYVAPETPFSAGHRGVDLAAPDGVVRAPADGVVHFAGVVVDRPVLSLRHEGGLLSSFEPVETELAAGDAVSAGEVIGTVLAGHCTETCVHFGVRLDGEYVSPLAYVGGIERAVLLPTRGAG